MILFTIFGATGDLTTKKLIPALYTLIKEDLAPEEIQILAIGRREYDKEQFLDHLKQNLEIPLPDWEVLACRISYFSMDFSDSDNFSELKKYLDSFIFQSCDGTLSTPATDIKHVFYLATAPSFIPVIANGLLNQNLLIKGDSRTKIVFEKPFGDSLATAKEYNSLLLGAIDESQVFRIDHYLGKEMLQNVLTLRFANKMFEGIWNSESIEKVEIISSETEGVKQRAGYYDKSGALRDMLQNHMLQMLALVAIDPPLGLSDTLIKNEKVKVIKSLSIDSQIIFGQYEGYLNEQGIAPDSQTETFVALKTFVHTQRWKNTPFYLITGKALSKKKSEIRITFKEANILFEKGQPEKNKLIIEIFPREGIVLQFNGKAPGFISYVMPMKLDYCHLCGITSGSAEAYEKLLLDVFNDDASLFTRWDEIEAAWEIVENLSLRKTIHRYKDEEDMMNLVQKLWNTDIKI